MPTLPARAVWFTLTVISASQALAPFLLDARLVRSFE